MVIELSGEQFGLKSYACFKNRTSSQREFDLKSQVSPQTKIARHEVQLPLNYIFSKSQKIQSPRYRWLQMLSSIFLQFDLFLKMSLEI